MTDILRVDGLSRHFGGLKAVDDVSFGIPKGGVVGLIGPNGAGKTTLFNLLVGLTKPTAGSVYLNNSLVTGHKPNKIAAAGMTKTFQNVSIFPEMTVLDNVLVGGLLHLDVKKARQFALQNVERVGLSNIANKIAGELSFPERAKVELARALCTKPEILLLDEVMAALNEAEMDEIMALVSSLNKDEGLTFIVIEHHMRAIMNLCDSIIVLNFGQIIANGVPQDIANDPVVIEAYLGKSNNVEPELS